MAYEYKIEFDRLMQQIEDTAIIKAIGNCIPDPKERKCMTTLLEVFVRHGIKAADALDMIREYTYLIKEDA